MKCKHPKTVLAFLSLPLLVLAFAPLCFAFDNLIITENFVRFDIGTNGGFGVQYPLERNITITITVLSGTFFGNGTVNSETYQGTIAYYAEADCQINVTSSDSTVGILINDASNSGNLTANLVSGSSNVIHWNIPFNIWLPIHLGLGILGLIFLCIVPVYGIKKFKQKDYVWTMVYVPVGILVGIALVIAWLWV